MGSAPISVVITVRQDRQGLAEVLAALAAQTRPADEILIVDAGSDDGTAELLAYWRDRGLPIRILDSPGAGISAGRNEGIAAAAHERIAITDAGCRPEPTWLAELAQAFEDAEFVGGTYTVDTPTPLEHAVAVSLYPAVGEVEASDLPTRLWQLVFGRRFTPRGATGRSMGVTREAWRRGGGFPEQVNAGEDVAFSAAVIDAGATAVLAPKAEVVWRGRDTWRGNAQMYFRYAQGDALLGRRSRAAARLFGWSAFVRLLLSPRRTLRGAAFLWLLAYNWVPVQRARRTGLSPLHWWRIPYALAVKDAAMIAGAVSGTRRHGLIVPGGEARSEA
jgi:glycosyltransferase involved in cell wall biosynthesis